MSAFENDFFEMLAGSTEAFENVYREISRPLFTYVYRIVQNKSDAEDIVQDVFVDVIRGKPLKARNPKSYIYRIAHNKAADLLSARTCGEELDEETPDNTDVERESADRIALAAALRRLSVKEREVISLHLNSGLTFREISGIIGEPVGTLLWRYSGAIKKMRRYLS